MKSYILTETSKARVCFVNVPDGATGFKMFPNGLFRYKQSDRDKYLQISADRKWQLVSRLSQVSEEQAAGIVDGGYCSTNDQILYEDYEFEDHKRDSSTESLYSLIRSLNILEDQDPVVLIEHKN